MMSKSYTTLAILSAILSIAAADSDAREHAKPWYLRDIQIGETTLPFSPVTVIALRKINLFRQLVLSPSHTFFYTFNSHLFLLHAFTFLRMILVVSLIFIFPSPGSKSTATASHILMDGDDAKSKLEAMKKDIQKDYKKFAACAAKNSKCPSGKAAGGKLGTFKPGSMVPPFDKAIFDKDAKVGEVIGPIQTSFGWHLIWIEERNMAA